ncbi:MAG TPA: long-chain-fatty-acid--CoA ligase [Mycobacteriales bacterium]|nr:long-chain-fatty-acid--CoA ligase [Mycobacteriales bacterium]
MTEADAWRRSHWNTYLERHACQVPDRLALVFEDRTYTWKALRDRVAALAGALARRGVASGDRVALLMGNRPEFLETVLAATRLGAVAVPINFRLTAEEVAYVLQDCAPRVLLTDGPNARTASAARRDLDLDLVVLGNQQERAERYDDLVTEPGEPEPLREVAEDAPALIMYTSGTTGRPKGAVLSHANLQGQALTIVRAWRLFDDDEVNLVASPLFHIGGLGSVVPLLLIGGCIVLLPSGAFSAAQVLDALEQHRVTSVFLVPTAWQAVCADPTLASRDLSSLRTTCWGAAPASTTLLRRMAEVFPGVTNVAVFGQTEMSPVTCVLDGRDAIRRIGSVGRPISTLDVRVVDPEMRDVPQGGVGEIVYRGPTQMAGYWRNEAATAEAFRGGWFHSGDLVRVDEEGFVYVVDRAKDMIISGGENIYCAEVEDALAAHPAITEVAVIGRPHPRWGETPVAVVALQPGQDLTVDGLRGWARERLASYKIPTVLEVVDMLPRNASGKVVKGALRERYGGQ